VYLLHLDPDYENKEALNQRNHNLTEKYETFASFEDVVRDQNLLKS
jgi:hypothetical protein